MYIQRQKTPNFTVSTLSLNVHKFKLIEEVGESQAGMQSVTKYCIVNAHSKFIKGHEGGKTLAKYRKLIESVKQYKNEVYISSALGVS